MEALFENITTVITKTIGLLGTVSAALMSNEIFAINVGVVFFGILMGTVFTLVRKLKKRGK